MASGLLFWAQGYLFYLVLPLWAGLEAAGILRVLMNLVMPILQSDGALVTALVPSFVRAARRGELAAMVRGAGLFFGAEAGAYWLVLIAVSGPLVAAVYDGQFVEYAPLLLVLGALPMLASAYNILAVALRVKGMADRVFWATVGSATATCTVGFAAVWMGGVAGAAVGLVVASATQVAILLQFFVRAERAASRVAAVIAAVEPT
jgi:O-antigen/teichoic acid export membrane protein